MKNIATRFLDKKLRHKFLHKFVQLVSLKPLRAIGIVLGLRGHGFDSSSLQTRFKELADFVRWQGTQKMNGGIDNEIFISTAVICVIIFVFR